MWLTAVERTFGESAAHSIRSRRLLRASRGTIPHEEPQPGMDVTNQRVGLRFGAPSSAVRSTRACS